MRRARGSMKRLEMDRWLLRVYLGETAGKRRYSSKVLHGTTAQARKELTAMLRATDTKTFVAPSRKSLGEYLESWLQGKIDVAPRTRVSYRLQLARFVAALHPDPEKRQLKPWDVGHIKLEALDREYVQKAINGMMEAELSRRTMEYARTILRAALEDAVRQNLLPRNPVRYTDLPPKVARAHSVLTMAQVDTLLERTKEDPLNPLWNLLLNTGLRPQEALALKWEDLDLEGRWLSVQRAVVDDGHGNLSLSDSTKTEGSRRRIGLAQETVEALRKHKKRQNAVILAAGEGYQKLGLVFPNSVGNVLDHNLVRRKWKATLKACRLPVIRLYDTRHTHLTALLQNGADLAWIAARAGHKDIKMTASTYAHVLPETHREMGELTDRMLKQAREAGKRNVAR